MKFFDACPTTAANRWPTTPSTHMWSRWNGAFIMHSFSPSPSARPWVSLMNPIFSAVEVLILPKQCCRLREYCTVEHNRTNVCDILCVDWHSGEWVSLRLSRWFLWESGKPAQEYYRLLTSISRRDFHLQFLGAYERYKAYKMATTKNYAPHRLGLIAQIILYLIPGIVIFLFLPSLIFSYFENWSYTVSLYYSFITLTTIGEFLMEHALVCSQSIFHNTDDNIFSLSLSV